MPLIPLEYNNIILIVFLVGCLLPAIITEMYGEPSMPIKIIVTFGMVIVPLLALVYNLIATIIGVLA